jgi:hypothetical protein
MTVIRFKKDEAHPFIIMSKLPLNDTNLSWKAKGILAYLLSLPDDWNINIKDLQKRSKDGGESTRNGINELIELGYITRERITEKGKFKGYSYTIYEKNLYMKKPYPGNPNTEKPNTEKPNTGNPHLINNNNTNNPYKRVNKLTLYGNTFRLDTLKEKYDPILKETLIDQGGLSVRFNTDSKLLRNVYKYLYELEHGQFTKKKELSSKLLEGADLSRIESVSSLRKIKVLLTKAARTFKRINEDDSLFSPKDRLSLDRFFFNPETGMSWFAYCVCLEPKENFSSEKRGKITAVLKSLEKKHENIVDLISKIYPPKIREDWTDDQVLSFYCNVRDLLQWREENKEWLREENELWGVHFGKVDHFFNTVAGFLEECNPKPSHNFLLKNHWTWTKFSDYLLNNFDIRITRRKS